VRSDVCGYMCLGIPVAAAVGTTAASRAPTCPTPSRHHSQMWCLQPTPAATQVVLRVRSHHWCSSSNNNPTRLLGSTDRTTLSGGSRSRRCAPGGRGSSKHRRVQRQMLPPLRLSMHRPGGRAGQGVRGPTDCRAGGPRALGPASVRQWVQPPRQTQSLPKPRRG
jgi:hypothetical protein